MRAVFEILPPEYVPEKCSLFCEVSNEGFSYCIKEEEKNSFLGLAVYHFDQKKPAVGFPIALQVLFHQKDVFRKKFRKVCVVYSYPQSVLIPFPMYRREKNQTIMNMMFGDVDGADMILTDVVTGQSMYNCYRLPAATLEMIKNQFPNASMAHQYSLLLKNSAEEDERLSVIFYSKKIVVNLIKEGKHQLVNSYMYNTPQDVAYTLLNICSQFGIKKNRLEVSGLIEENSPLYKEIYKYFDEIQLSGFREGSNYSEEISAFPSHYFSNLFDLDSCE